MVLLEEFEDGKLCLFDVSVTVMCVFGRPCCLIRNVLICSDCGGRQSEVGAEARPGDRRLGGGRAQGHQDGHPVHEDDTAATADLFVGHGHQGEIQRNANNVTSCAESGNFLVGYLF